MLSKIGTIGALKAALQAAEEDWRPLDIEKLGKFDDQFLCVWLKEGCAYLTDQIEYEIQFGLAFNVSTHDHQ